MTPSGAAAGTVAVRPVSWVFGRPSRRLVRHACRAATISIVIVMAVTAVLAGPATAQVYQWTDRDGVDHYSTAVDRIPAPYRDRARVIDTPTPTGAPTVTTPAAGSVAVGRGPILVEAHVNGVPLTLVIDTGASRTVIAPDALRRAGFDPATGQAVRIIGATGATEALEIVVPRLDVAGVQVGPLSVIAHEVPALAAHGLLGRDVLDHFVLTVDAARGRATLQR